MPLTHATFALLFLFFPGIVANLIGETLTAHRTRPLPVFFLHSFVWGLGLYFVTYILGWIGFAGAWGAGHMCWRDIVADVTLIEPQLFFVDGLVAKAKIPIKDVLLTTLLAVPAGFYYSRANYRNIIHKYAQKRSFSKIFGDLDVWGYLMNSENAPEWVVVRDLENDLAYEGWIEAFADTHEIGELLMREVVVFQSSTAKRLYKTDVLYLAAHGHRITIESADQRVLDPNRAETQKERRKDT